MTLNLTDNFKDIWYIEFVLAFPSMLQSFDKISVVTNTAFTGIKAELKP